MRGATGMVLMCTIGVVLLTGYLNHKDEVDQARITWEQAIAFYRPSVQAKTFMCRLERHEDTILAAGIATPDSFRAVHNRLHELWHVYCGTDASDEPGIVILGNE